jgi:hypothetical protein
MAATQHEQVSCQICGLQKDPGEVWPGELLRGGILELIKKRQPQWDSRGYICLPDLNRFRAE